MAENAGLIAAMNEVAGQLRIANRREELAKLPPKVKAIVEHILLQPTAEARTEGIEFLSSTLPDKYAGQIRAYFTDKGALNQFDAVKTEMRKPLQYSPLDEDRQEQLDAYHWELKNRTEIDIDNSFRGELEAARAADTREADRLGRKAPKVGLNEMGVIQKMEERKNRIDVKPQLLQRERELMEERHTMKIKANNPLISSEG